ALAAVAFVFNVLVLPRIGGRRLYRPVDNARGFPLGILLYPLAVLLLILTFSSRLDIAAAAWGILAFGDGAATLAGTRFRGRALPWNAEKSVAGSVSFAVCAGVGGIALAWWTRPGGSIWFVTLAPIAAAIAAALVESMPVRLDDNISVPVVAGGVLWIASLMTVAACVSAAPAVATRLPWALALNVLVAWVGHRARTVSTSGAIAGALVGAAIYAGGGAAAWALLLLTFVLASVTSRLGLKRKMLLGISEEHGGRRGVGNAVANCGVAAIAALAAVSTSEPAGALLALTVALTAAGSDTVASEIGKSWGRSTFLITTLGRVPAGTSGAMSLEGTAAGLIAALALASVAAASGLIAGGQILLVVAAATAGALVESALGATLEGPGILNNDMLNFINTAIAAAVALVFV
ncbi:MAG TPA: DUF92 domain-containing protein, partial [Vicinamibacterales bacterium]|nr:DUF92 domain-containing protein [Vicinamibacterales bacterium]